MGLRNRQLLKHQNYEFAEWLLIFLHAIHGEKPYEIRFIPEGEGGKNLSVLRYGDYYYLHTKKGKSTKCTVTAENFESVIATELYRLAEGSTPFFTVNSPNFDVMETCKTKDKHIVEGGKINCQFTDIDAPKEVRKDPTLLKKWKNGVRDQILAFPLRPSIVVETKHGYHVYWLLENGQHKMYRHIQMQLIQHFDGDKNCINESRVLRLPNFMHRKDPKKPYPVRVKVFAPERRYTQEELKRALPELKEETLKKVLKEKDVSPSTKITEPRRGSINDLIHKRIEDNIVKIYENKITLHCCLPDHPDRNPSAWIDTEYMWYHCSGCGSHSPIDALAEEIGWKDVLEEWNKYDIDIDAELNKIKELLINIEDLPHIQLSQPEQEQLEKIAGKVINKFVYFGQQINDKHKQYIHDIVQIMFKANKDKPYLIPLDMGGGKSTIITIFLQEILTENVQNGAVIVKERREDVKLLANELNKAVDAKVAYAMYGFDENECQLNVNEGNDYDYCIAKKTYKCPYMQNCRYWQQTKKQKEYPVVVMTLQRLLQDSPKLTDDYGYFINSNGTEEKYNRDLLIIDEKPKIISVKMLNTKGFQTFTDEILRDLHWHSNGNFEYYNEFKKIVQMVKPLYKVNGIKREVFHPIDKDFSFSGGFWKQFYNLFDYNQSAFEIPAILESIVKNGGHTEVSNSGKVKLTTSYYHKYNFADFNTIIFDGTADIDLEYHHEQYHVFNFEPLRSYEGLTIYQCDLVSGSKTSMKDEDKLKAFCEDVKKIAIDNPYDTIFLPVFKQNENDVRDYLEEYIEAGRIIVAHYGETRGSNKFKDCSIIILGGILHKGENHYIGKAKALYEQRSIFLEDVTCSNYDKVRRFNDTSIELVKILDMLVDYSQELKRSSQRDNSRNVGGKVYIFHNDKMLLDIIGLKFPNCQFAEWTPKNIIKRGIDCRSNNKNVKAISSYIDVNQKPEIYFDEIRKATKMTPQLFSNTMKNKTLKVYIQALGYVDQKEGKRKKLVKVR